MRGGKLDRRITIEEGTEKQDAAGNPVTTWSTYCTRWANVERIPTIRRLEEFQSHQYMAEADIVFQLRYDSLTAAITPKMRILYDGRYFNIQSVFEEIGTRHRMMELFTYEWQ